MAERKSHGPRGVTVPYLRAWRDRQVLKQQELAQKAGVARSTVARGERGDVLSVDKVRALAKALGITEQQLREEDPAGKKRPAP